MEYFIYLILKFEYAFSSIFNVESQFIMSLPIGLSNKNVDELANVNFISLINTWNLFYVITWNEWSDFKLYNYNLWQNTLIKISRYIILKLTRYVLANWDLVTEEALRLSGIACSVLNEGSTPPAPIKLAL